MLGVVVIYKDDMNKWKLVQGRKLMTVNKKKGERTQAYGDVLPV